jgi:spore coat polysaccharide biosynthesis protein SpsF
MPNIVAIIEARMASTRLPGKTMRKIVGKPMLALVIERLQRANRLDGIIVATTVNREDDVIIKLAKELGVKWFRGSSEDVLGRVLKAAKRYKVDIIVEITGDCPLIDSNIVDSVISRYLIGGYDFVANCVREPFPRGLDTRVFSTDILQEVSELTQDSVDREHVSLYIYEHPKKYRVYNIKAPRELRHLRLCVDTKKDLQLIRRIYSTLYPQNANFTIFDVLKLIEDKGLAVINADVKQKAVR